MSWVVVRARSDVKVERSIRETMGMLNLTRVNHAVIIPENAQYKGMLQKAKDYITWGNADADLIEKMISERGRLVGDKPITDAHVKEASEFKSIKAFAAAIASGDATVKDMPDMKRVFRLHPPRGPKGWGGLKRTYVIGGALGSRGEDISDLVERMI
ncbi:MAG: 50S ribosomal protein L30 [Candidatus Poseidoniaceae archaeon]|nr:50S ribosomal protein L30 [Candidatus Poseidoniaceae archaeon]|tara:strand:- start:885 stop:1355 length:471 start_codon:yes stop_codon:yes gene_type:complete